MTYDLLLAGDFDRATLAGALADLTGVTVDAVDIADRDAENRTWDSPVLCTYAGDVGGVTKAPRNSATALHHLPRGLDQPSAACLSGGSRQPATRLRPSRLAS